ncbi:hypothetical protein OUZ56_029536 [Daphnia magna]|uniref:Uncharacterized protein n=1 Tax=Daphnia magna TaxID=35525 RepID=A0ABR0B744_9CRUS|nr:hypothetical protein OUZ56_029536 [Daphnia magna]
MREMGEVSEEFGRLSDMDRVKYSLCRILFRLIIEKAKNQLSGIKQRKRQQGKTGTQKRKAFLKKNPSQWNQDCDDIESERTKS